MSRDPRLAVREISKTFGSVRALDAVSLDVRAGEVTCLLGDNGAGKTTLIKILSGVYGPTDGEILLDGTSLQLSSPREALARGITTVYQDLAIAPLMSVWRNFFLGSEPLKGRGLFRRLDPSRCERISREELARLGVQIADTFRPAGTLSGGEQQSLAIARALHRGGRLLVLDEPTAALGVRQTKALLRTILEVSQEDVGVILVTHNPHHAFPVGDHFVVLRRGQVAADRAKDELSQETLVQLMAGEIAAGPGGPAVSDRLLEVGLVRRRPVRLRHRHIEQTQEYRELAAVVDYVVENEAPNDTDLRYGEQGLAAALERPVLEESSVARRRDLLSCVRRVLVEQLEDLRCGGGLGRFPPLSIGWVHVELILIERHRGPHRQLREVRGEPAECHRFLVRAPFEAIVGDAFQDFSRGRHLLVEFGQ
jgi:simple sugar transport system ATP-binding protein